jgi:transposase
MPGRVKYTEEFKRDAVSQVKDRGYSVKDVAERLGICTKSLYAWVCQYHAAKGYCRRQSTGRRDTPFKGRACPRKRRT